MTFEIFEIPLEKITILTPKLFNFLWTLAILWESLILDRQDRTDQHAFVPTVPYEDLVKIRIASSLFLWQWFRRSSAQELFLNAHSSPLQNCCTAACQWLSESLTLHSKVAQMEHHQGTASTPICWVCSGAPDPKSVTPVCPIFGSQILNSLAAVKGLKGGVARRNQLVRGRELSQQVGHQVSIRLLELNN